MDVSDDNLHGEGEDAPETFVDGVREFLGSKSSLARSFAGIDLQEGT